MCLAIPGRIRRFLGGPGADRLAEVDYGFTVRTAALLYTPEAQVGDYVIVQAGFTTRVLSGAEAEEALAYLREAERSSLSPRRGREAFPPGELPVDGRTEAG